MKTKNYEELISVLKSNIDKWEFRVPKEIVETKVTDNLPRDPLEE